MSITNSYCSLSGVTKYDVVDDIMAVLVSDLNFCKVKPHNMALVNTGLFLLYRLNSLGKSFSTRYSLSPTDISSRITLCKTALDQISPSRPPDSNLPRHQSLNPYGALSQHRDHEPAHIRELHGRFYALHPLRHRIQLRREQSPDWSFIHSICVAHS
jgi:hypothetical protein